MSSPVGGPSNNPRMGSYRAVDFPDKQCTFIKRDGTRCKQWAVKGTDRCNRKRHMRRGRTGRKSSVGVQHLPRFFSHVMTETLRQRIDRQLETAQVEQIELYEELALIRESASESVRLYALTQEALDQARMRGDEDRVQSLSNTLVGASSLMAEHLNQIKDYAQAIARVRSLTSEKIDSHALYGVVHQVTRLLYDVLGEEHQDVARVLERRLREEVVLPTITPGGTTITPDAEVLDMDDTVPREPDVE